VAVAAAIALVAVLLIRGGEGESEPQRTAAETVSVEELRALPASAGHPVYWAGEQTGTKLELSQTGDGSIYIRYLPRDAEAGDPRPDFLTVGTYPEGDAVEVVRGSAKHVDAAVERVRGGGVAYADPENPGTVFLAYPSSQFAIEVYDPSPRRALELVESGTIQPVS